MAYALDENYKDVNEDVNRYLQEQQKLQRDMSKGSLLGVDTSNISSMAAQFRVAAENQDRIDAFEQMANDYHDGKRIEQIMDSRRRDPLNAAINERNDRVQAAMQQGSFVDARDKNFMFHTNPGQYEQASIQADVINQGVVNNANITAINQQKDLQLNQAELDIISQLSGKNEYGQDRQLSVEELSALREKMQLIQDIKATTSLGSQIERPHVMSTEELMENQMRLQQLQQQLSDEYHQINDSLIGKPRK